jgi:mRNA interferase RelE/StbE
MTPLLFWLLGQPLLWAVVAIIAGPILFLRGFRLLQTKQLISDTPRSTIRGAALGAIEVSGKIVGPYPLVSPRFLRERLEPAINPRQCGKPLRGEKRDLWRYRVGDYRLTCDIQDEKVIVLVLEVGHRKDIYR